MVAILLKEPALQAVDLLMARVQANQRVEVPALRAVDTPMAMPLKEVPALRAVDLLVKVYMLQRVEVLVSLVVDTLTARIRTTSLIEVAVPLEAEPLVMIIQKEALVLLKAEALARITQKEAIALSAVSSITVIVQEVLRAEALPLVAADLPQLVLQGGVLGQALEDPLKVSIHTVIALVILLEKVLAAAGSLQLVLPGGAPGQVWGPVVLPVAGIRVLRQIEALYILSSNNVKVPRPQQVTLLLPQGNHKARLK